MIVGIYWENQGRMIDLDFSMISAYSKTGWDADYRSDGGDILFSGDITSAPKGATELFYVQKQSEKSLILLVNYYNYDPDVEVPFKIIVAREQIANMKQNYIVNPNNVFATVSTSISQKQKVIGLLVTSTQESKFYFSETYLGKSTTSSSSKFVIHARRYLRDFYENTISLNEVLVSAGANLVTTNEGADMDLSPEKIEKDSILNLLIQK